MRRAVGLGWAHRAFWIGLLLAGGVGSAAQELPYLDWRSVVSPLETQPLVIRADAKGDGRFWAPRSGGRRHRGIDILAALKSPVRAIRSGRVVRVGTHRGLGRFVELEHRHHLQTLYAHLDAVLVEAGARVRQGAVIGTVGKTGNARHPWITPHLHVEVWRDGEPMDPQALGLRFVEPANGAIGQPPPPGLDGRAASAFLAGGSFDAGAEE